MLATELPPNDVAPGEYNLPPPPPDPPTSKLSQTTHEKCGTSEYTPSRTLHTLPRRRFCPHTHPEPTRGPFAQCEQVTWPWCDATTPNLGWTCKHRGIGWLPPTTRTPHARHSEWAQHTCRVIRLPSGERRRHCQPIARRWYDWAVNAWAQRSAGRLWSLSSKNWEGIGGDYTGWVHTGWLHGPNTSTPPACSLVPTTTPYIRLPTSQDLLWTAPHLLPTLTHPFPPLYLPPMYQTQCVHNLNRSRDHNETSSKPPRHSPASPFLAQNFPSPLSLPTPSPNSIYPASLTSTLATSPSTSSTITKCNYADAIFDLGKNCSWTYSFFYHPLYLIFIHNPATLPLVL